MKCRNYFAWVGAPFALFKASFKDPFKTRPLTGIRALSVTKVNLVLLHVF